MKNNLIYGAIPENNGVTFRVWAPSIEDVPINKVELCLYNDDGNKRIVNMTNVNDGDWECFVPKIKSGQKYNYLINGTFEKIDPWAKEVTSSIGYSIVTNENDYQWQCNDFVMPSFNELVVYQLHVRTFPDDAPDFQHQQLKNVADEFWYLQSLGINAIQLLPTAEFAGDDSWGYNPSCIFAVESSYGGSIELKKFIDKAHMHGIAVFLDVVYNHLDSDGTKNLYQFTPWHKTLKQNNTSFEYQTGGIYFYNDERAYTPFNNTGRPDYGRNEVRNFISQNALMWLKEYRIDGLRFDSVGNIRNIYDNPELTDKDLPDGWRLLREINLEIKNSQPWKITIAEDLKNNEWITKPASGEWDGGAGFNTQWDERFYEAIKNALVPSKDESRDMYSVKNALYNRYNGDAFQQLIFLENHDIVAVDKPNDKRDGRLPDQIQPGHVDDGYFAHKRSTLGAAILFTAPGIPMIHQGQEILEWRRFGDGKANAVDWTRFCKKGRCQNCISFKVNEGCNTNADPNGNFVGIYRLYRDLIKLRRNWFNNTRGLRGQNISVLPPNNDTKVIAYHRWENGGKGDDVMVIANFSNQTYTDYTIGFPNKGLWKVRFNSDWEGYDPMFNKTTTLDTEAYDGYYDDLPYNANLNIGPYSAVILSQN